MYYGDLLLAIELDGVLIRRSRRYKIMYSFYTALMLEPHHSRTGTPPMPDFYERDNSELDLTNTQLAGLKMAGKAGAGLPLVRK